MLWLYGLIAILGIHQTEKRFALLRAALRTCDARRVRRTITTGGRFLFHVGALFIACELWVPVMGTVGWTLCGVVRLSLLVLPCGFPIVNHIWWVRLGRNILFAGIGVGFIGHGFHLW